jgi:asparagine synthase (glutamine-hydrolysing)
MVSALGHRGPDDASVLVGREVILGHTRLSIIDPAGGAQPMRSHDSRFAISFNGEIFNYRELRGELVEAGHHFRTQSDTEVILESYRAWGTECFNRFNGQWALALWDCTNRRLILSRDRLGIRPLYYTALAGDLLFASEIKALLAHPRVALEFSGEGLAETFTLWGPKAPRTAFANVYQLEPGTFASIDSDSGTIHHQRYWRPEFVRTAAEDSASIGENAEQLRAAIIAAAELRFRRSDVPVAAYLSGGLDSTVTAAVLSTFCGHPLPTFSVAFEDDALDESRFQTLVASRLGSNHETLHVSEADIASAFPEVVWHAEQPLLRAAPAPLFLLSEAVRAAGYKVVVTGEGSDEVLAGYDIFREAAVRRFVGRDPSSQKRKELLCRLYPWMQRSPGQVPAFASAFFSAAENLLDPAFSHLPRWETSAQLIRFLTAGLRERAGGGVVEGIRQSLPRRFGEWHPLEQAQYLEFTTLLSGYILSAQGDRMLMAHSVEGRFPFLDPAVIDWAAKLPPRHKLMGLDEKHVLKRAFEDVTPKEVVQRPKQPYRSPDASCFFDKGRARPWVRELLCKQNVHDAGVFDPTMVEVLLRKSEACSGRGLSNTDNMRVLAVISTMLLHERFVSSRARSSLHRDNVDRVPVSQV